MEGKGEKNMAAIFREARGKEREQRREEIGRHGEEQAVQKKSAVMSILTP